MAMVVFIARDLVFGAGFSSGSAGDEVGIRLAALIGRNFFFGDGFLSSEVLSFSEDSSFAENANRSFSSSTSETASTCLGGADFPLRAGRILF